MSKTKNRNSLLSSHNRTSVSNSTKDELLAMKYVMDKPAIPLYPLNELSNSSESISEQNRYTSNSSTDELTYPDFKPWKDTTHLPKGKSEVEVEKLNNEAYLNKGYFEGPLVANEYYSARNLIQASLFSSSSNCDKVLKELSQHLVNSYRTRNEVINKIKYNSNKFKIPPRVTLTALKKEAWLRDLANPDEPLLNISNKLPHGIKNKMLVDILCSKNIPTSRALWLTKCVLYSELLVLKKKYQSRLPNNPHPVENTTSETFETQWLQEWTHQLVDYFYKFSKDMCNITIQEKKQVYLTKLNYLLNYVQALYIECLLDKSFFLTSILKFLKEGLPLDQSHVSELLAFSRSEGEESSLDKWLVDIDLNYGQRLISITLVKMFWKDILELDYLSKELSELLLLNYYFIERIPTYNTKSSNYSHKQNHTAALSLTLKLKLLSSISDTVNYLFKHNTNVFIIPNYWILVNETLYKILLSDVANSYDSEEQTEIRKQLKLIKYRNESLMLSMKDVQSSNFVDVNTARNLAKDRRRSNSLQQSLLQDTKNNYNLITGKKIPNTVENDNYFINRNSDDTLNIIDQLDRLKLNDTLAEMLIPSSISSSPDNFNDWRVNLKVVIYWAITIYREQMSSSEGILIICNFLKRKVLQNISVKNVNSIKAEFENEILEIIYNLAHCTDVDIIDYNLYVLINELYQLKVITISSYLRKLIASGLFYVSPSADGAQSHNENNSLVETHLAILQNLPVLNNKQCDSILRKWTPNGFNFEEKFEKGKLILKEELVDRLMLNSFDGYCDEKLTYIKNLKVGLKFLLVNWLTNYLKTSITKSPKLIHINPNIITSLYNFYALCDNLTVFFKVLIKFILRNEGKVIICYMDSLYLISKLIIRHFKLVKFIAGKSYESTTTGYELFKLIILNYKDLLTRDNDYYNFSDVWYFIDNAVEKNEPTYGKSSDGNNDNALKHKNFNQLLFAKETVDSPMRIHANSNTPQKNNDSYTATVFRNDLDLLLEAPIKLLNNTDITDFISTLELNVSNEAFNEISNTEESVIIIMEYYFKNIGEFTELHENLCMRLLINSKRSLDMTTRGIFFDIMKHFIINLVRTKPGIEKLITLFKKLMCFEVYQPHELFLTLRSILPRELSHEQMDALKYELLFGNPESDNKNLFNDQALVLRCIRYLYVKRHSNDVFITLLDSFSNEKETFFNSYALKAYNSKVLSFFRQFSISNTKFFMDGLSKVASNSDIISFLNLLIYISEEPIGSSSDLPRLASIIDEFNLPVCQVLIKIIIMNELRDSNKDKSIEKLRYILDMLLNNLKFHFVSYNSYFGELFNYLSWEHKLNILFIFEHNFLCNTEFIVSDDKFTENSVCLMSSDGRTNLLSILKDYFKKFSVSSLNTVTTSKEVFHNLSKFLLKVLQLANADIIGDSRRDAYNTISIFLRILIIHKLSLTSMIIEQDGQDLHFIKNLIALLESKFLCFNNEKLRILLYDLLLLMKSSITLSMILNPDSNLADDMTTDTSHQQHSPSNDYLSRSNPDGTEVGNSNSKYFGVLNISTIPNLSSVFNISEPNISYPLKKYTDDSKILCALMLEESELQKGGDIYALNDSKLILLPSRREALSSAFDILNETQQTVSKKRFKIESYELLEDTGIELNNGCINLLLFDAFTTKENPP